MAEIKKGESDVLSGLRVALLQMFRPQGFVKTDAEIKRLRLFEPDPPPVDNQPEMSARGLEAAAIANEARRRLLEEREKEEAIQRLLQTRKRYD